MNAKQLSYYAEIRSGMSGIVIEWLRWFNLDSGHPQDTCCTWSTYFQLKLGPTDIRTSHIGHSGPDQGTVHLAPCNIRQDTGSIEGAFLHLQIFRLPIQKTMYLAWKPIHHILLLKKCVWSNLSTPEYQTNLTFWTFGADISIGIYNICSKRTFYALLRLRRKCSFGRSLCRIYKLVA